MRQQKKRAKKKKGVIILFTFDTRAGLPKKQKGEGRNGSRQGERENGTERLRPAGVRKPMAGRGEKMLTESRPTTYSDFPIEKGGQRTKKEWVN